MTLPGGLVQVEDADQKLKVRQYVRGPNHEQEYLPEHPLGPWPFPGEPVEALLDESKTSVWKLVRVKEIIGLKALPGYDS
ncbi:MAG TPA: hypothetical protein VN455_04800 [Methanotrichaceae archaeon]|nr:hypothetical protein [Methanotrichaceae archaeon]